MKRRYIKEQACISCRLCEVYCQQQHSQSKDIIKAFKKESPRPLPRLRTEKKGAVSFSVPCQHCDEPPCVYTCLTGALSKDPDSGIVLVDEEKCIGCWNCLLVCPFGAIRQDTGRGRIVKCDLCMGKDMPACVANCPNEALLFAETEDNVLSQNLNRVAIK